MKKLLVLTMVSVVLFSCGKKTPTTDYECIGYFTKDKWTISTNKEGDTITGYSLNTKFMVNDNFPSATDSVKLWMILTDDEFKSLPKPSDFSNMIFKALLEAKSNCKNEGTFRPFDLWVYPTEDKKLKMNLKFYASNAYGTPGELNGYFTFNPKTNELTESNVFE
jgi:hypothetical protein